MLPVFPLKNKNYITWCKKARSSKTEESVSLPTSVMVCGMRTLGGVIEGEV